jgi:quercetin dioxygenase-like cupin family protein
MALIARGEHMAGDTRPPQGSFTGPARQRTFHIQETPHPVRVSFVRFDPGALTHWHSHSGGQVLHVVEGEGRHCIEGGDVETVRVGDTATVEPGRRHWHGAGPADAMAHLAVSIGDVTWEGPPDP